MEGQKKNKEEEGRREKKRREKERKGKDTEKGKNVTKEKKR